MKSKKDFETFDDITELIRRESENTEIPDELCPDRIAVMLKTRSEAANGRGQISLRKRNIAFISRAAAFAAACAAVVAGLGLYGMTHEEKALLDSEIEYEDVPRPDSYDELYNIYSRIYLNSSASSTVSDDLSAEDFAEDLSDADMVKAADGAIYFTGSGRLYKVASDGIAVCADIGGKVPLEMYIENNKLILVSENAESLNTPDVPADGAYEITADMSSSSEPEKYVTADIYDISDSVCYLESFSQSGSYISSRVFGGNLSIVTDYAASEIKNSSGEDLDSFVPYYELNGKRIYAAAEDIFVFEDAGSADYTVASSYNIEGGSVSVKAVLGSSGNVFCPSDTLYIVSAGNKNAPKPYTAISSFSVGSTIEYISGGSVEGSVLASSLSEKDGTLRAAAVNTMDDGTICTDIYVLDSKLKVINSAGQLLPGEKVIRVSFAERYASLYTEKNSPPALVLDLSEYPPIVASDIMESDSGLLAKYDDNYVLGTGLIKNTDQNGDSEYVLRLSMFSASSGAEFDSVNVIGGKELYSDAAYRRRSVLINNEHGIIGVPVSVTDEQGIHSAYYLYNFDSENGFSERGRVEFIDGDSSGNFRKAIVSGNSVYIISDARVVEADISDMKIIRVYKTSE